MERTYDELAGIVDLFGGLTREELARALHELAFRKGEDVDEDAVAAALDAAVDGYYLVRADGDDEPLLVAGPAAFPALPEDAADLPHIMDVAERRVERETVAERTAERLATEAEEAVDADDDERAERLLDVSYDVASWGPASVESVRERLRDHLDA